MRWPLHNLADLGAAALLIVLGVGGFALSHDLPMRSGPRLGPGAMPLAVSVLVGILGLALLARAMLVAEFPPRGWRLRPALAVAAAILGFAAIEWTGLVVASLLLLAAAIAARPGIRWIEAAIYVPALTLFTVLVFKYLLKLPLALWPA